MKKILSLVLVTVMVMSLSIPVFAAKPAWVGNDKNDEEIEEALPKGLQEKAVVPYGHRKDQEVSEKDIEDLIEAVEDYIDELDLDLDSDDDGLDDATETVELIDLDDAEDIALDEKDGAIVKMSFDDEEYEFEIWFDGELFEVKVNAVNGDFEIESDDDEYDLDDVISYEKAKAVALDEVDEKNAMVVEVELDMDESDDDDDDDEELEATYEVKVMTDEFTYKVKLNAFNGNVIDTDSDENDDDDWKKNRERNRDEDEDDEGMVSAIENLIARIEYELEKDEPKLGHYMFQLESKFNVLQKIHGEKEVDYASKLEKIVEALKDAEGNELYTTSEVNTMEDLVTKIEDRLDSEEAVSEKEYDAFKKDADEYLDQLDEIVEEKNVEALIEEVKQFIFANNFGTSIGNFSQNEAMSLLTLVFRYDDLESEDLEEYFEDLKLEYKKFKMSKLVAGDYLETINEYKADLESLEDADLTESEEESRDDLIKLINTINANKKMALGTFYDIKKKH